MGVSAAIENETEIIHCAQVKSTGSQRNQQLMGGTRGVLARTALAPVSINLTPFLWNVRCSHEPERCDGGQAQDPPVAWNCLLHVRFCRYCLRAATDHGISGIRIQQLHSELRQRA